MIRRRLVLSWLLALCVVAPIAAAKGSAAKGSASSGTKTVHVKGYTKKDGTVVAPHDRQAQKSGDAKASAPSTTPTTSTTVARDAKGRIQRSDAARHAFARHTGYPNGRPGYIIDHIIPLACGGADAPSNMQWQTTADAKAKDRTERVGCR